MNEIKKDFPIFAHKINNKPLVYLDSGATTQKPWVVINSLTNFYSKYNANINRGAYYLSEKSSLLYEEARIKVKNFIKAPEQKSIIFTKNTTDAINLVANSIGDELIHQGDEIIISEMEHHSNLLPWQNLAFRKSATLKIIPLNDDGTLNFVNFKKLLSPKVKFMALTHVSNVTGIINPIKELINLAHKKNIKVLIDGAQAVSKFDVSVEDLDCDFYTFSGHKIYAPFGIGVLYGKPHLLEQMKPYQYGGGMVAEVSFTHHSKYLPIPAKFEAGTPPIAEVIALGVAIDYVQNIGKKKILDHELILLDQLNQGLKKINNLTILGTTKNKVGIVSFIIDDLHPHDIATFLDTYSVAVRSGQHCAIPLMNRFKVNSSTRVSLGIYNDQEDIDIFMNALKNLINFFKK